MSMNNDADNSFVLPISANIAHFQLPNWSFQWNSNGIFYSKFPFVMIIGLISNERKITNCNRQIHSSLILCVIA